MSHRETEPTDASEEQRHGKEQRNTLVLNRLVKELTQTNYTPITALKTSKGVKEDSYSLLYLLGHPEQHLFSSMRFMKKLGRSQQLEDPERRNRNIFHRNQCFKRCSHVVERAVRLKNKTLPSSIPLATNRQYHHG